jgi:hypothetical protein
MAGGQFSRCRSTQPLIAAREAGNGGAVYW